MLGIVVVALLAVLAITGVWKLTPLAELAAPERLAEYLREVQQLPAAPLLFVGLYVIGGLIVAPVLALIVAVAILFPPLSALCISLSGVLLSSTALYYVGACFGSRLRPRLGPTVTRIRDFIDERGIVSIALIRMLPIAPFSVVNLAAGSIGVHFGQYITGTALGMLPGIAVITFFGQQVRSAITSPTPMRVGLAALAVCAWLALGLGLQHLVKKRRRRRRAEI